MLEPRPLCLVPPKRPSIANTLSRPSPRMRSLAVARDVYLRVRRLLAIFGLDLVYASYDSPMRLNSLMASLTAQARCEVSVSSWDTRSHF